MSAPTVSLPLVPAARRLDAADLAWAADLLAAASTGHPALRYVCDGPSAPRRHRWLLRQLAGYALRHGSLYANAAGTALVLWLGPDATVPGWRRLWWLPVLVWQLGWAGYRRLRYLWHTQQWLRLRTVRGPHHQLLALAVHPAARGRGEGRRLLGATLALRQAAGQPCYLSTQVPALLPFYQRLGFGLVGHCPVSRRGPAGALSTWGLLWSPPAS